MERINTENTTEKNGKRLFQDEDRYSTPNKKATIPNSEWYNAIQEELCNVIESSSQKLDKNKSNQLLSAIIKTIKDIFDNQKPGKTGPRGPKGVVGLRGPQGARGESGVQGVIGKTGIVGPMGDIGLQGPQGKRGVRGPRGPVPEYYDDLKLTIDFLYDKAF